MWARIGGIVALPFAKMPASERLARMQGAVKTLLTGLGEDVHREGLEDTPKVSRELLG